VFVYENAQKFEYISLILHTLRMRAFKQLTPRKKAVAIALSREGLSTTEISKRLQCNQSTVARILARYRLNGNTCRKEGSGGLKKSTVRQDRVLKRLCLTDRKASSTDLKTQWETQTGVRVSSRTVRRRLFKDGLVSRKPLKKPLLTARMRKARLAWAKEHVNKSQRFWHQVLFSDESKFNLNGPDGRTFVRRRKGEQFLPECLSSTVKFPVSQMVWGSISSAGVGRLHFVNGTVTADVYIDILNNKLLPTIRDHHGSPENCVFQDDSAPCHRARKVKEWMQDHKIQQLPWPGNSPDLNPIENCWAILGRKVAYRKPNTKLQLMESLVHAWHHELDLNYIGKLIDSMPNRCRAVIKARGGATKY